MERHTVQALLAHTQQQNLSAADTAFALVALWLARLTGQNDFAAGFIFMRRIGSAALCATGPVIDVLPMAIHYDPAQPLTALAARLAGEVRKMRRHQRYDAEQVQRDLGRLGDSAPLYGPVINLKMFDYQLDFAGIEGITHQLASGPVRDLEIAIYLSEQGDLTLELLANAARYSETVLKQGKYVGGYGGFVSDQSGTGPVPAGQVLAETARKGEPVPDRMPLLSEVCWPRATRCARAHDL